MFSRKQLASIVAEFLGAAILTLAVISVKASGIGYSFFVALGAGLTLAILMYLFSGYSSGQFNPALTIGLWTARKVSTLRAVVYIIVQLLGGWAAYGIYNYLASPHLPAPSGHMEARVMVAELIGVFVFAFAWALATVRKYEAVALATTIGGGFAIAVMLASLGSLGLVNPAIALGVRSWNIWGSVGWGTYVLGPVIGAIVGVNVYVYLFGGGKLQVKAAAVSTKKKK